MDLDFYEFELKDEVHGIVAGADVQEVSSQFPRMMHARVNG